MHNSKSFTPEEQAILTTLIYSDVFNFPLTITELRKFLVSKMSQTSFESTLTKLQASKIISLQDGYYCLANKESCIAERIKNLPEVTKKLQLAKKVAAMLVANIPTIQFIGISGGLAVANVSSDDDIDLFIIVKEKMLFISRFWILVFLEMMGVRRRRKGKKTADMICVNLLIDERSLAWQPEQQDLYVAHEIAQVLPLQERNHMYDRFIKANDWVSSFLPYAFTKKVQPEKMSVSFIGRIMYPFLTFSQFEVFFRKFQKKLIRRNQTKEIVTDTHLGFHPNDYKTQTLDQLRLKMRQLGLLTKP